MYDVVWSSRIVGHPCVAVVAECVIDRRNEVADVNGVIFWQCALPVAAILSAQAIEDGCSAARERGEGGADFAGGGDLI